MSEFTLCFRDTSRDKIHERTLFGTVAETRSPLPSRLSRIGPVRFLFIESGYPDLSLFEMRKRFLPETQIM